MSVSSEDGPKLVNPRIFELELKPKLVLSHDVGAGAPCTRCDCPGLDLHFWRKRCRVCSCRMEDHEVVMEKDHAQILIGRLFGAHEIFEGRSMSVTSSVGSHEPAYAVPRKDTDTQQQMPIHATTKRSGPTAQYNVKIERVPDNQNYKSVTEYAWVPMEDTRLVEKFMESLPEEERPVLGTEGEKNRMKRLAHQLPLFDFTDEKLASQEEKDSLDKFVKNLRANVVGVGEVVEVDREGFLDRATKDLSLVDGEGAHFHVDENGRKTIPPADCKKCTEHLSEGDIGVQTDHGNKGDTWHPHCFRCCVCDELLADLIYFFHRGQYYCGRHFAEKQYPRCSGCDELIFAKEYTLAEGKAWHFEHFACDKCDLRLGGHRYITKDEQPHCLQCYLKHYAKTCCACEQKISADEKRLNYGDMHWHAQETCFRCAKCSKNLIGQKFILKDKILFCSAACKAAQLGESSRHY